MENGLWWVTFDDTFTFEDWRFVCWIGTRSDINHNATLVLESLLPITIILHYGLQGMHRSVSHREVVAWRDLSISGGHGVPCIFIIVNSRWCLAIWHLHIWIPFWGWRVFIVRVLARCLQWIRWSFHDMSKLNPDNCTRSRFRIDFQYVCIYLCSIFRRLERGRLPN